MSPETAQLLEAIAFIVVALAGVYMLWRYHNGKILSQLIEAAKAAVMAAEQAKSTGEVQTNDQQLSYAIDALKILFPAANRFSNAQILYAIEAAVPVANAVTAQIEAAWAGISAPKPMAVPPNKPYVPPMTPPGPTLGNMGG